eukprot:CAMPEP_0118666556 /NCGR_PEP_ID=MMETSP0785-20121206/19281_1 /TAXON_ID=91992 /ORGANISM="Bolidomonas pacifica, Strain CCMP 1866" /LENGTH=491 /DNA_ID=CAMNT_0006560881 /DNA_START=44 /DNA_END=1516 /DNA_ORIENTATION=+
MGEGSPSLEPSTSATNLKGLDSLQLHDTQINNGVRPTMHHDNHMGNHEDKVDKLDKEDNTSSARPVSSSISPSISPSISSSISSSIRPSTNSPTNSIAPKIDIEKLVEIAKTINSNDNKYTIRDVNALLGGGQETIETALLRRYVSGLQSPLSSLPYTGGGVDYDSISGRNCDNCVGYVSVPVGIAGPVKYSFIDLTDGGVKEDKDLISHIPIATTEGGLIASVSRGCKALRDSCTVTTCVTKDAMTRCPALEFKTVKDAVAFKVYVEGDGIGVVKESFEDTTKYGKLERVECKVVGRMVYFRVEAKTGEAMGMNMVSKGTENVLRVLKQDWEFNVITLSGNGCSDKKPSATNFVKGRGKSVTAEAIIKREVVERTLKSNPENMKRTNIYKNQVGSAVAGNLGGMNAHAANVVAGVFIATGQDPAHTVEGSMCTTVMDVTPEGDLYVSVTLPSICVGTIGGGTELPPQKASIKSMGCEGTGGSKRLAGLIG